MWFGEVAGQGWVQISELSMALFLSALIGLEREIRVKSAGLRTHTVVGLSAALIMLVSKYGFGDVLEANRVVLDPSRVAAQIVTGIGFIGGGLIFVRRDSVRGLTTAAIVWLTTAVGMACGAALCDNDVETSHPREFTLEGRGQCIRWLCPLSLTIRLLPAALKQKEAVGRPSFQRRRRPRPNSRTGLAVVRSRPPTSCGYCARSTRRSRAASARSCGARGSIPRC